MTVEGKRPKRSVLHRTRKEQIQEQEARAIARYIRISPRKARSVANTGRGKGHNPTSPWGIPAKGYKTRRGRKSSDKFIVRRRNKS